MTITSLPTCLFFSSCTNVSVINVEFNTYALGILGIGGQHRCDMIHNVVIAPLREDALRTGQIRWKEIVSKDRHGDRVVCYHTGGVESTSVLLPAMESDGLAHNAEELRKPRAGLVYFQSEKNGQLHTTVREYDFLLCLSLAHVDDAELIIADHLAVLELKQLIDDLRILDLTKVAQLALEDALYEVL